VLVEKITAERGDDGPVDVDFTWEFCPPRLP